MPRGWPSRPSPPGVVVHRLEAAGDGFTVKREDDAYRVRGKRIERLAAQTDFENEESAERFQRDLARPGSTRARQGGRPARATPSGSAASSWSGSPSRGDR